MYTYGGCFDPGKIDRGTRIGRYCSFAKDVRVFSRNHPTDFQSTHPFFYNRELGYIDKDAVSRSQVTIEHDVWVGYGAMILPRVTRIGIGAVIGAGAVVACDVPDSAVVVGNPAKVVRYRFDEDARRAILESHWWDRGIGELGQDMAEFTKPFVHRQSATP
jgi:virginiamycin A acetyltransferase